MGFANLQSANLTGSLLPDANLFAANFTNAMLINANLSHCDLSGATFAGANLRGAVLVRSILVGTNLERVILRGCWIYGCSTWDVQLTNADQCDLLITRGKEPRLTVDDLELGQFVYLLLNNERIRNVIDTITSKVVLILGRFSDEGMRALNSIRDELRKHNFAPILFSFKKPASKDLTGTIETLARMARFVIADITDPRSVPHEFATIAPLLRTTPIVLLQKEGDLGYGLASDYCSYPWILGPISYCPDGHPKCSTCGQVKMLHLTTKISL